MACKVLEINEVGSTFPRCCQCCDAERMDDDVVVEAQLGKIALHEILDGPPRHRLIEKSALSMIAGIHLRSKQWPANDIHAQTVQPGIDPFVRFGVQGHSSLFSAFAFDLKNAMTATRFHIANRHSTQFTDTTTGVSQNGQQGPVPNPRRRFR